MSRLSRVLTNDELAELESFLARGGSMQLPEVLGFITASISAPVVSPPSVWQGVVLGDARFDNRKHGERIRALLSKQYDEIAADLVVGRTLDFASLEDAEVGLWCSGYLEGAEMSRTWREAEDAKPLLTPFAVWVYEATRATPPELAEARAALGTNVVALYQHWLGWRRSKETVRHGKTASAAKPCFCGSGKPYAECCALIAN